MSSGEWLRRLVVLSTILVVAGCMAGQTRAPKTKTEMLRNIGAVLDRGIADADRKNLDDPSGAASMILKQLRETQRYVKAVERGREAFDAEEMLALTRRSIALVENLRTEFKLVLNVDVAFALGGFRPEDLLPGGRSVLDEFADSILRSQLPAYRKKFPDMPLMVTITTQGYADSVSPGDALGRELLRFREHPVPENPVEKRKLLNRLLSLRRSTTINRYIRDGLRTRLERAGVEIGPPSVEGRGETFPSPPNTASPPYRERDARRRICKIYSNILIQ